MTPEQVRGEFASVLIMIADSLDMSGAHCLDPGNLADLLRSHGRSIEALMAQDVVVEPAAPASDPPRQLHDIAIELEIEALSGRMESTQRIRRDTLRMVYRAMAWDWPYQPMPGDRPHP